MKTIHKFPFDVDDRLTILMPIGATILHVACQDGRPCLWALVDTESTPTHFRRFRIFGTGHSIPDDTAEFRLVYLATFQKPPFVWHLFESLTP